MREGKKKTRNALKYFGSLGSDQFNPTKKKQHFE
jgi:hypothetical protein